MVWKTFSCLDCAPQPWTVPPLFVWGRRKLILLHQAAHCVCFFYNSLFEKSNVSNYQALICTAPKCQGPDANSPPLIFSGWCSKFRSVLFEVIKRLSRAIVRWILTTFQEVLRSLHDRNPAQAWAWWQIWDPSRRAFWIPHPPWDLGSRCISCGAKSAEQKPAQCSSPSGTTTHSRSHVSNSVRPRRSLQATRLHVCEEFSRTTWRGCSRVFPPLMLLIKPHAYSSAWSLSLKLSGGRAVLYFPHTVYEHVSVLAVSCLTGAAALRLM